MRAGYAAYYAAASTGYFGANHKPQRQSSPYSDNFKSKQWERGWQLGQKNHETGKPFSHNPLEGVSLGYLGIDPAEKKRKQQEHQKKQAEFLARQKKRQEQAKLPVVKKVPNRFKPSTPRNPQEVTEPLNLKRIDKFNKKYRTKV